MRPAFPPYSQRQRHEQRTEARSTDKGHGRITKRHLQASSRLAGHLDWPGLRQVCQIERVNRQNGKETREAVHAITSLKSAEAHAPRLLAFNRGHWSIESQHWIRDVTLSDDACREKRGHAGHNLSAPRNLAAY